MFDISFRVSGEFFVALLLAVTLLTMFLLATKSAAKISKNVKWAKYREEEARRAAERRRLGL